MTPTMSTTLSSLSIFASNPYVTGALAAGILLVIYSSFWTSHEPQDGFNHIRGTPFFGSLTFYTKRQEFLLNALALNYTTRRFSKFKLFHNNVIIATGEEARKIFFSEKEFSFGEGYSLLMGGVPKVDDVVARSVTKKEQSDHFRKRLVTILRKENVQSLLPKLFSDLEKGMAAWPCSGRMDPFEDVYHLAFQLIVRTFGPTEIADDPVAVTKLHKCFQTVQQGSTPAALIFPWLPSPSRVQSRKATYEMYGLLATNVSKRMKEGRKEEDAVQHLIDQEDPLDRIMYFITGSLFAGIINSGINICWTLLHLKKNPEWLAKVKAEIEGLLSQYSPDPTLPMSTRLSQISIDAWDDATPIMEAALQETIRFGATGASFRRNLGEDMIMSGHTVKKGDFIVYPYGDIHMDPKIYPEPKVWDPTRWQGEDEPGKGRVQWPNMFWGAGRYPCLGMRYAKLEMKSIIAMYVMTFDYKLVDRYDKPVTRALEPNKNDRYRAKPKGGEVYFEYRRVDNQAE
ncbi:hypothetical protein BOTBODRAFT_165277 [Botryobasidium botryosum FD-172 SS1]|uniref:Cytochrome P450 n=1 Tax=Botryobasidium botryosum (strain FD-172 SS1) TaxID=930990 RepID=A0A067MBF6_BOTB1|nr:hypothetical protein BOTBODRAFT_165277 [Botryobasidium botryosum FD-172 SS1]